MSNHRTTAGLALAAAAGLLLAGCGVTNTGSADGGNGDGPFYQGKEINLIVPFDAGGASDVYSRMLAGHLSTHIEGQPRITIENVPGGAQKDGVNRFERTEHNGLNLAMSSGGLIAATKFDTEGIQFDLARYEPLMAFGGTMVIFGSTAAGIHSLEDLRSSANPIFYGGLEFNASEAVRAFALQEMGLTDFEPLMGYDGGGAVTAAVLRGELTIGNSTSSHYIENVKQLEADGSVVPLMTQGYVVGGEVVRDPAFPDLPTMPEAYRMLTGQEPEGVAWDTYKALTAAQTNLLRTYWIHGDAPEEARVALRDAVAKLVVDEDFVAESTRLLHVDSPPQIGAEVKASTSSIVDLDPQSVTWLEDYMARNNA
ncbi:type 2 periplasmic-binding domain-containing protein [Pseudonocardia sp. DLS-67]